MMYRAGFFLDGLLLIYIFKTWDEPSLIEQYWPAFIQWWILHAWPFLQANGVFMFVCLFVFLCVIGGIMEHGAKQPWEDDHVKLLDPNNVRNEIGDK